MGGEEGRGEGRRGREGEQCLGMRVEDGEEKGEEEMRTSHLRREGTR